MGAATLAPALPLIGLIAGRLITDSGCGLYMSTSTVAMIALIVHRRRE